MTLKEGTKLPTRSCRSHLGRAVRDRLALQGARFEYNEFAAGHTVTPEMMSTHMRGCSVR